MINSTDGQLVFRKGGDALRADVRESLTAAANALLKVQGLGSVDLSTVTTKTHITVAFAKFVLTHTVEHEARFDEGYVEGLWQLYNSPTDEVTEEQFYAFTLSHPDTELGFKRSYARNMRRGLGIALIALHSRGAITLPMRFEWPAGFNLAGHPDVSQQVFSELLGFIRLLDRKSEELPHPAFASVGTNLKRREWFLSYGTKLLLATGWLTADDATLDDLLALKAVERSLGVASEVIAYKALIDVLRARYGERSDVTVDAWSAALRTPQAVAQQQERQRGVKLEGLGLRANGASDADLVAEVVKVAPSMAYPEALRARPRLPGLEVELAVLADTWLEVEEVFLRTIKRETYRPVNYALGFLNIYLFFYLAYWFQRHPETKLKFPDTPQKLIPSVFVSRLLTAKGEVPLTFIEFMNAVQVHRQWVNDSFYAPLKQLEVFFEFVELHSDDLTGCAGFRQPIPDYVYPASSRSKGTNKRPIPRRVFGLFLDYIEALKAHLEVVLDGCVDGTLNLPAFEAAIARTETVVDTFATAHLVGFIPVVFARGRTIPLRYIPNCLSLAWFPVAAGQQKKLPQPHALNQILVALYTGLRHNHIQWLDGRHFDAQVTADNREFAPLHVNTDKVKKTPWAPHVNFRVIEVLRDQRRWRALVKSPAFELECFYNSNPNTKWAPILPLFSAGEGGAPHPDSRYTDVWQDVLCAVDALLPSLGEKGLHRLFTLEPPGVAVDDAAAVTKRLEYGARCKKVCELGVKSLITPHSARVTVVSQFSTLLPADIIGSRITGQATGVVYHYVKLEEEQLRTEQTHQAMALRERAYRSEFESLVSGDHPGAKRHVHADRVNSNFAKSLRENLPETLLSYGCISITMNEDATGGLDVLRETRAANAAENKTEICPYGNHCPPEVIRQWRGPRRCGLCQYAVRSVDHLPAVSAKTKEFKEMLDGLTEKVEAALAEVPPRYSDDELDRLDQERDRIAEELSGWKLNEEVLEAARSHIAAGLDERKWVVQKPEIILADLRRVEAPSNLTAYLLARLGECIAYPTTESPQMRARFDLLRRDLLARSGRIREAFDKAMPVDPAAECAGLLRTVVAANGLNYEDLISILEGDAGMAALPTASPRLLLEE
jgi:hypothetical protein